MAEILLKIGDGSNYDDGDCLCAFTTRQSRMAHAADLCKPTESDRNESGLLQLNSLSRAFAEATSLYRFNRISAGQVMRTNLEDRTTEIFGKPEIDVRLYVRRRRFKPNCKMWGEDGSEVWFGGNRDMTPQEWQQLWQVIESRTGETPSGINSLFPLGRLDIRSHLAVRLEEITPRQARSLTEPQFDTDDNGRFVWERTLDDGTTEEATGTESEDTPPDDRAWSLKIARKRRRRLRWLEILGDLAETRGNVEDRQRPVGVERFRRGRMMYESKAQPLQLHSRANRKARKQRSNQRTARQ